MLQRLLTILLVLFGIHLAGGTDSLAAESQKQEATIRLRSCLRVNKPLKQAVKTENVLSVRSRVPQVCKTCSLRIPDAAAFLPGALLCWSDRPPAGPDGAGSAYVLRLIYPFHFFR